MDPQLASYGVENPLYAIVQLAQTTMRSELGKITLDKTFEERDTLNEKIVVRIRLDFAFLLHWIVETPFYLIDMDGARILPSDTIVIFEVSALIFYNLILPKMYSNAKLKFANEKYN